MRKFLKRGLSLALTMIIVMEMLPLGALAQENESQMGTTASVEENQNVEEAEILYEVEERREDQKLSAKSNAAEMFSSSSSGMTSGTSCVKGVEL